MNKLRQLIREIIEAEIDADGNLVGFAAPKSDKLSDFQAGFTRGVEDLASDLLSIDLFDRNRINSFKNLVLSLAFKGGRGKNKIKDAMTQFLSRQSKIPNLTPEIYGKLELFSVMYNDDKQNADKILSAVNLHPQKFADIKQFIMPDLDENE